MLSHAELRNQVEIVGVKVRWDPLPASWAGPASLRTGRAGAVHLAFGALALHRALPFQAHVFVELVERRLAIVVEVQHALLDFGVRRHGDAGRVVGLFRIVEHSHVGVAAAPRATAELGDEAKRRVVGLENTSPAAFARDVDCDGISDAPLGGDVHAQRLGLGVGPLVLHVEDG